ncbi:hypothetical protein [Neisseria subflava]|uniref:hypothetical protein n=1 Tax=Neisseria subflava TaxID=28449 RepID=UPI00131ABAB6|nr:hypothetical protein [Neisseria subflava]
MEYPFVIELSVGYYDQASSQPFQPMNQYPRNRLKIKGRLKAECIPFGCFRRPFND